MHSENSVSPSHPSAAQLLRFTHLFEKMSHGVVYQDAKGAITFANPAAERLLGLTLDQMQGVTSVDPRWKAIHADGRDFHGENHPAMLALRTGKSVLGVTMGVYHPEEERYYWLRVDAEPIFENGAKRPTQVMAVFSDITQQFLAEKETAFQQRLQKLLLEITQTYISVPIGQLQTTIQKSMADLGTFIEADRMYIMDYDFESEVCINTYEWCAEGIEPQIDELQEVPFVVFPQWLEQHVQGKTMLIQSVADLDADSSLYALLAPQGIQSLIAVPMMDGQQCLGFVGLDAVRHKHYYSEAEQQLLQVFAGALVNVNKRLAGAKAIFESEKRYRQIAENISDVIWTADLDLRITYCSRSFVDLFDQPVETFEKHAFSGILTAESEQQWQALGTQLKQDPTYFRKKATIELELEALRANGETFWIHLRIKPQMDEQGKFVGYLGVVRNIDARKRAELSLLNSKLEMNERLKELRCIYDVSILSQQEAISLESFLQAVAELLPPAFNYPELTRACLEVEEVKYFSPDYKTFPHVLEQLISFKGVVLGSIQVGCERADFLPEEQDLLKAVGAIIERFYEKKQDEWALHKSEEKYRIIADNTYNWEFWEGIAGEALYHSPACERITGYQPADFMEDGKLLERLILPEDWPAYQAHLLDRHEKSDHEHIYFRIRHKSGQVVHVEHVCQAIFNQQGEKLGVRGSNIDVTARKLAALELQTNAEMLSKLLATQTTYVLRTDLEGRHTYWNAKFEADYGWLYANKGLEGSDSLASICEYDKHKAVVAVGECLADPGKIAKVELDKPTPSGEIAATLWEFVALVDANGMATGLQCVGLDITERKKAETALKKSEEQYRGLIESSDAAISMLGETGTYLYLNAIAAAPFGITPEEGVGKHVNDFFKPADAAAILADVKEVMETNEGKVLEPMLTIEGQNRWFRTSIQPVRDESGRPYAVFLHSAEITHAKEAELKLRENEQKYRALFFDSPEAYLMIQDGRFIECNKASEQMIGSNRDFLIGKTPADISPKYQPGGMSSSLVVEEKLATVLEQGKLSFEWVHLRADGSSFLAQVNIATMLIDGKKVLFVSWTDITEKRQAEAGIRRLSQVMEQSPISILVADLNFNIEYANHFALYQAGGGESLVGKSLRDFYASSSVQTQFEEISHLLAQGKDWKGVIHHETPEGHSSEFATFFPIVDEHGALQNYILIREDITDRLAMQDALMLSELRLAEVAEHSNTVIWEIDLKGLYTFVSPVASKVFGREPEAIVGRLHYYDLHPEEGRAALIAAFEAISAERASVQDLENPIEQPDGSIKWVSTNAAPFFNAAGDLAGYRGSDKDITAKKLAEEELQKFRTISDQANYGTAIAKLDGTLEYVNGAYAAMHGYQPAELLGKSLVLLHDEKVLEAPMSLFDEIKNSTGLVAKEVNRKRKDGSVFPAIMSSSVIYNERGEQLLLSATVIDITERKEMEQALVELNATLEQRIADRTKALQSSNEELMSEIKTRQLFEEQLQAKTEELQTFFDVSLDLMCIADMAGNFIKLNKAWEELLGYDVQTLEHRRFMDFVHPDDVPATLVAMSQLSAQELVINFTNRYRTSSGDYRFIEWHSVPVGTLVYAAARDITERIEQADVLRRAQLQAEEANKSKSEFLSRMSHELRTPLNSILGFAQLLEMGQLAEQQKKGVTHILKSGKHLLDLINEVLDISRIEAGRISVSVEPVDVVPILIEVADLLSPYAASRNIQVHVMRQITEKVFAQADKQRLKQIVTNLMNNALKYNEEGGQVWVSVEVLSLESMGGKAVRIGLRDTGIGIAADDLAKIFNPFERLSIPDNQIEGTGLGLTVVKQLVELIGGQVWVESELGVGSTFYVDLLHVEQPSFKKANELSPENPAVMPAGNAGVVLYVEDNPSNVELIEQVLQNQRSDLKLVTTAFGAQALELTLTHRPKLILLDLNLPDLHGSEVIGQLKSNPSTASIPVIVISADALPAQISQMMQLGAANYLTKPLDLGLFLHEIERYTQS